MDLQPNKRDVIVKPITKTRISASEWNQLVGSCMAFITEAGFTPDASDNEQFLNAFKAIAASLELVGANTNLSNLTPTGEAKFNAKVDLNLNNMNPSATAKETIVGWCMPDYSSAVSFSSSITAPYDCMIECGITEAHNSGWVEINGERRKLGNGRDDSHCMWYTAYVPKGITITSSGCNVSRYYKLKGV